MDPAARDLSLKELQDAKEQGRWADAVKHLVKLAGDASGRQRSGYLHRLAGVLDDAGETFLANRLQRTLLLHCSAAAECWRIAQGMAARARTRGDVLEEAMILSIHWSRWPGRRGLVALARIEAQEGRWRRTLDLLALLPASRRPHGLWLTAALRLRWWGYYEQGLRRLKSPAQRALWSGHRASSQGDFETAEAHYGKAGKRGADWLRSLREGISIAAAITDDNSDWQRLLQRWSRWQANRPGPREWTPALEPVRRHAGSASLLSIPLNVRSSGFWAEPQQPLQATLAGPARVMIRMRPAHRSGLDGLPLDDWLELGIDGTTRRLPVSANTPSTGLVFEGWQAAPGVLESHTIDLPDGLHRLVIRPRRHRHFIQLSVERPRIPMPVLPYLTPDHGEPPDSNLMAMSGDAAVTLVNTTGDTTLRQSGELEAGPLPRRIQWNDWKAGPKQPAPSSGTAAGQLADLLWRRETGQVTPEQALVEAERRYAANPGDARIRSLRRRLTTGAQWRPLTFIENSSGLRRVAAKPGEPESEGLRIRTYLSKTSETADLLSLGQTLDMVLADPPGGAVQLELTHRHPGFLPAYPIHLRYRLDQGEWRDLWLNGAKRQQTLKVQAGTGRHFLQLLLSGAEPNHFAQVRVLDAAGQPLQTETTRTYHLATAEQPLQVSVKAPAWMRIDELRGEHVHHRYREVAGSGWRQLELYPQAGQREAMYRLFLREPGTPPPREKTATAMRQRPAELPAAELKLEPRLPQQLQDRLTLGVQEDGAWSPYLSLERRSAGSSEDESGDDSFLELGLNYRKYAPYLNGWYRAQPLLRLHDNHDRPTLGLINQWREPLEQRPITLKLGSSLYAQSVDGNTAWSARFDAGLSGLYKLGLKGHHLPEVKAYIRHLSLDGKPREAVDRDIYTDYKAEHRYGWSIADTLSYKPWLDTTLYAKSQLTSNEQLLDPDQLSVQLGWRQLAGSLDWHARLKHRHYFADDDRSRAYGSTNLQLDLDWRRWSDSRSRWQWGLNLDYGLDDGQWSGGLSLSWHDAEGRGYRDFAPGSVPFRAQREWRIPRTPDNALH